MVKVIALLPKVVALLVCTRKQAKPSGSGLTVLRFLTLTRTLKVSHVRDKPLF